MDYFKTIDLKKEPFSNSPDPNFFFRSREHVACLQQLELAIRLRRGLNVVIGDVGIGKTTLCRQLIRTFADEPQIETHLMLDPHFGDAAEFLRTVCEMLAGPHAAEGADEWRLKESIKQGLYHKGLQAQKTVVLIIDEGQKIPAFCLEVLREFLNYETNENKLLQVVIFAQHEFEQTLAQYDNFADRINLCQVLKPLGFQDTKDMIRFRVRKSSVFEKAPEIFTLASLWAIYRATGGYPRKIIHLCHRCLLTMIIRNRLKVNGFLVRACARRSVALQPKRQRLRLPAAAAVLGLLAFALIAEPALVALKRETPRGAANQHAPQPHPGSSSRAFEDRPAILGQVTFGPRDTLAKIIHRVYGIPDDVKDVRYLKSVRQANPQLYDIDDIAVGRLISLPALPVTVPPSASEWFWIALGKTINLQEALLRLETYSQTLPSAGIISYWNRHKRLKFVLVLKEPFENEALARNRMEQLPPEFMWETTVFSPRDKDTVWFSDPFFGRKALYQTEPNEKSVENNEEEKTG